MSPCYVGGLVILAKVRQISQNYANGFNRCHPAMMEDLAILANLASWAKFRQIGQNYANDLVDVTMLCWRIWRF